MKRNVLRMVGLSSLAIIAWVAIAQPTRPQIQAAPSYIPIGVAASGNASMAWFHNPSTGTVLACQSGPGQGANLSNIQCVTAKLP